jgi:hypothetical protein
MVDTSDRIVTSDPQFPRTRPKVRPLSTTPRPLPYFPSLVWSMTGGKVEEAEEVLPALKTSRLHLSND